MAHTDADALFRAIVADPDDDTARLVYADHLDESGRAAEAEFIRVQCRLAAGDPGDPEYPALLDREGELRLWLQTHVPAPRPTFPGGLTVDGEWWRWSHRGFPRFLQFDGDERPGLAPMRGLAAGLAKAFARLPTRWLALRGVTAAQLAALLKQPVVEGLSRLTVQLEVGAGEEGEAARLLAGCRHLRNLRALFVYFPLGAAGCEALAGGSWDRLEVFAAPGHEVPAAGLWSLAGGAAWFRGLRELSLADGLSDDAFEALAGLPPLPRLHTLDLGGGYFTEAAWERFGRTRAFPALARLELGSGDLSGRRLTGLAGADGFRLTALAAPVCLAGAGDVAALAAAPWAGALRVLDLDSNVLEPGDVKAVAGSRAFARLRHLDLSRNSPGVSGLGALVANPALRGLRALRLGGEGWSHRTLTPAHLDRFLGKLDLPDLRHLDLSGMPVGGRAARHLADGRFASLRRLALSDCRLTDAAVARLVAAPALQNLIELDLRSNDLRDGPAALADRAVLPQLAACELAGNRLPAALVRRLRRRPGVTGA